MAIVGKKVIMNGCEGEIIEFDIYNMKYIVRFNDPDLVMLDWVFSYDEIKDCIIDVDVIKCECGLESSAFNDRERNSYAHAQWCAKFKRA